PGGGRGRLGGWRGRAVRGPAGGPLGGAVAGRGWGPGRPPFPSPVDTTAVPAPDNGTIAERLETLASLLDLAGSSYYSVRAYRRAAELIRSTPAPVAELVRAGRVREPRRIGPSIGARLRQLVGPGRPPGDGQHAGE